MQEATSTQENLSARSAARNTVYARYPSLHEEHPVSLSTTSTVASTGAAHRILPVQISLASALGWFSIGLGIAKLLAPRKMAQATGLADRPDLMRALGTRGIASGAGILSGKQRRGWIWSRLAGDVMDLLLLAAAADAATDTRRRRRVAVAAATAAGITALDVAAALQEARIDAAAFEESLKIDVAKSIAINLPPAECYRFWRDFANFPRFMKHVEDIRIYSDTRSHWKVKAPAGNTVEWDADITYDQPGQLLVWHSAIDADIDHAGQVRFEEVDGGQATLIHVELQYRPPAGKAGAVIARLLGEEPGQQIEEDLRRFKQLIETGEISTTIEQTSGSRSLLSRFLGKRQAG